MVQISVEFMGTIPKSMVGSQYFTLAEVKLNAQNVVTHGFFNVDVMC
jgi:hypothetical protein